MEPVPARRGPAARAAGADGGRVRRPVLDLRPIVVRVPAPTARSSRSPGWAGRDHLFRIEPGHAASARSRSRSPSSTRCGSAPHARRRPGRRARPIRPSSRASTRRPWRRPASCAGRARSTIDPATISQPESIEFPTTGERTAHALYYPPTNPAFTGPDGEKPPLVVLTHGGPTSNALDHARPHEAVPDQPRDRGRRRGLRRQHRLRPRLPPPARRAVGRRRRRRRASPPPASSSSAATSTRDRLAIEGGSAGGYTTLAALAFRDVFAAGISLFGVGDLELLERRTPTSSSRTTTHRLVGPYPEAAALYRERSPIHCRRPDLAARSSSSRASTTGSSRPTQAEAHRRGAGRQRHPVRLPRVRGRGPRVPRRRRDPPDARGAPVVPRPGLRVRAGRHDRAARGARARRLARTPVTGRGDRRLGSTAA